MLCTQTSGSFNLLHQLYAIIHFLKCISRTFLLYFQSKSRETIYIYFEHQFTPTPSTSRHKQLRARFTVFQAAAKFIFGSYVGTYIERSLDYRTCDQKHQQNTRNQRTLIFSPFLFASS